MLAPMTRDQIKAVDVEWATAASPLPTRSFAALLLRWPHGTTRTRLGPLHRAILQALVLAVIAAGASPGRLFAAESTVHVGVIGAISDAPFYIGDKKGYFHQQGITVEFVNFKDSAQMTA